MTWPNQQFDVNEAKNISSEGHPDLVPSQQNAQKESPPIGAIVGGVVGGIAVIGIAIALFVVMKLRRTKPPPTEYVGSPAISPAPTSQMPLIKPPAHYRQMSDESTKSLTSMAYMISTGPTSPTSPSVVMTTYPMSESGYHDQAHSPSSTSMPFFPPPSLQTGTSSPTGGHPVEEENLHMNITPFMYHNRNTSPTSEKHTRQGSSSTLMMYDDPQLPPLRAPTVDEREQSAAMTQPRRRVNPPPYCFPEPASSPLARSEAPSYAEANRSRTHVRTTREKGSMDTQESLESSVPGMTIPQPRGISNGTIGSHGHAPSTSAGSISAIDEFVDPLGFEGSAGGCGTNTMEGLTIITGGSQNLSSGLPHAPPHL